MHGINVCECSSSRSQMAGLCTHLQYTKQLPYVNCSLFLHERNITDMLVVTSIKKTKCFGSQRHLKYINFITLLVKLCQVLHSVVAECVTCNITPHIKVKYLTYFKRLCLSWMCSPRMPPSSAYSPLMFSVAQCQ